MLSFILILNAYFIEFVYLFTWLLNFFLIKHYLLFLKIIEYNMKCYMFILEIRITYNVVIWKMIRLNNKRRFIKEKLTFLQTKIFSKIKLKLEGFFKNLKIKESKLQLT